MSITVGLQVPVIPFVEVLTRFGTDAPAHMVMAPPHEKAGVIFGVIFTVKLTGTAHCPEAGWNM